MVKSTVLPEKSVYPSIEKSSFSLCDAEALPCAVKTAEILAGIKASGVILYGHQNDLHRKAGERSENFTESDTADVTGEYAALQGFDALCLTGVEHGKWNWPKATRIEAVVKLAEEMHEKGSILSLSAHMPNFYLIHQKVTGTEPLSDRELGEAGAHAYEGYPPVLIDGSTNFSGYTPNDLRGHVVQDIMPGKFLNYLYLEYLDLVCDFLLELARKNISVIWRPFHENTGGWFWWGVSSCTPEEFRDLWQYTFHYMTEERKVHNLIWAYSPGSENKNESQFLERYPGNDYVDLIGFDMYQQCPYHAEEFWGDFEAQCSLYSSICEKNGKIFANTETGIMRPENKALLDSGNEDKDWYNKVCSLCLKYGSAYFLLWANFWRGGAYYSPYAVSRKVVRGKIKELSGHELLDSFISFYNRDEVIFSKGFKAATKNLLDK